MLIVYNPSSSPDRVFAVDTESLQGLRSNSGSIEGWSGSPTIFVGENNEETIARFNDLVEAMAADKTVYDVRQDVGYWKEKKAPAKKPGRKPAAEKPAAAHHEPEPKK